MEFSPVVMDTIVNAVSVFVVLIKCTHPGLFVTKEILYYSVVELYYFVLNTEQLRSHNYLHVGTLIPSKQSIPQEAKDYERM